MYRSLTVDCIFVAGRSDDSGSVLSEMCYSASGLLALVNDSILRKAAGLHLALVNIPYLCKSITSGTMFLFAIFFRKHCTMLMKQLKNESHIFS